MKVKTLMLIIFGATTLINCGCEDVKFLYDKNIRGITRDDLDQVGAEIGCDMIFKCNNLEGDTKWVIEERKRFGNSYKKCMEEHIKTNSEQKYEECPYYSQENLEATVLCLRKLTPIPCEDIKQKFNPLFDKKIDDCNKICLSGDKANTKTGESKQNSDLQEKKVEKNDTSLKTSGGAWSKKSSDSMNWDDAKAYCANLNESGYSDWRLPTISELRTLIQNCPATETGGACRVTDECLSWKECSTSVCGCSDSSDGKYSKLGDTAWFWSSSERSDNAYGAWNVGFSYGNVSDDNKNYNHYVRCLRVNTESQDLRAAVSSYHLESFSGKYYENGDEARNELVVTQKDSKLEFKLSGCNMGSTKEICWEMEGTAKINGRKAKIVSVSKYISDSYNQEGSFDENGEPVPPENIPCELNFSLLSEAISVIGCGYDGLYKPVMMVKSPAKENIKPQVDAVLKPSFGNWSKKAPDTMNWSDAKAYCADLNEGGYSDWRLPTISELRTLIKNCPVTETGGACRVTNDCLSWKDCRTSVCDGCSGSLDGRYSKLGDTEWFWSSSELSDIADLAWRVDFRNGHVYNNNKYYSSFNVRCLR